MKKFILPTVIFLLYSILFIPFFSDKVFAQEKEPIGCKELRKILNSEKCPIWVVDEGGLWCGQASGELIPEYDHKVGIVKLYKNRPPDYTIDPSSDFFSEDLEVSSKCVPTAEKDENNMQPDQPQSDQTGQQTKTTQKQTEQNKPSKDGNPFNIFGINPFETWLNLKTLVEAGVFIKSGASERFAESVILHGVGKEPIWEKEAREIEEARKFFNEATKRLAELEGKVGEADPGLVREKERVEVAKLNLILKGGGALIELQSLNGQKGVLEKGEIPILKSGAVDVIVEPQNNKQFKMQTPDIELIVIGTEFSVVYDQQKRQTLLAVYKGQVEVKPLNGGKSILVAPDGDKPGTVLAYQKLSITRLVLAGMVLIGVIGGAVLVLRKRLFSNRLSKKKK